jgi:hypothetical protein
MSKVHSRWIWFGVWYVFFSVGYLFTGHFFFRTPMRVSESIIDIHIPFISWNVFLYFSHFVYLPLTLSRLRSNSVVLRFLVALCFASGVGFTIFAIFPTQYERVSLPVDSFQLFYNFLYKFDSPTNVFPSLHAALAFLAWRARAHDLQKIPFTWSVWLLAILLSTVTTRQHVAHDIAAGLVLGVISWFVARKIARKMNLADVNSLPIK